MEGKILKDMSENFRGRAVLYKSPKKVEGYEYFIVSAVDTYLCGERIKETLMFPADEDGRVLSYGDVFGIGEASVITCINEFEDALRRGMFNSRQKEYSS